MLKSEGGSLIGPWKRQDDCQWKDGLLFSEFPREGFALCHGAVGGSTHEEAQVGSEPRARKETVAGDFTVVSMERNK